MIRKTDVQENGNALFLYIEVFGFLISVIEQESAGILY